MIDKLLKIWPLILCSIWTMAAIFFLKGCFGNKQTALAPAVINIKIDSSFATKSNPAPIAAKPIFINGYQTPATIKEKETIYRIDTAATKQFVLEQFNKVLDAFLKVNTYGDTLYLGDMGYVAIKDTVQKNMFAGRSFNYSIKQKTVVKTVTVSEPPVKRNQLYFYGGFEANTDDPFKGLGARGGLAFKTKGDQIISAGISAWPNHQKQFDINYFQKISFRKNK